MGDFSIDILRHNEHQSTAMFLNMLAAYRYAPTCTILRPTRITEFTAFLERLIRDSLTLYTYYKMFAHNFWKPTCIR